MTTGRINQVAALLLSLKLSSSEVSIQHSAADASFVAATPVQWPFKCFANISAGLFYKCTSSSANCSDFVA